MVNEEDKCRRFYAGLRAVINLERPSFLVGGQRIERKNVPYKTVQLIGTDSSVSVLGDMKNLFAYSVHPSSS